MANLASSGQISLDDIIKNRTGAAGTNVSLKDESETFASGSTVDGSSDQTTARRNLEIAPYALSEFYNADFNTDIISSITVTTAGGGGDTDSVDGEDLTIGFVTDGSETGTYTVQFLNSGGSVIGNTTTTVSSGTNGSATFSSLNVDAATYRARVKKGFATQDDDATFTHHDAIGSVTITDPSDTTVAASDTTHDITHARSIADESSINDYNWTFSKYEGDGSNPNPTSATTSTPTVRYTGPGIYTAALRVDGTPSQARNSTSASSVEHRIDYTKSVSINNPSSLNEGSTITATIGHQGFSSGVDVDLIQASNNSVLLSNDHGTDSRIVAVSNQDQTFTAPARTDSTLSVKVKAFDGSDAATSNAFNIYPLISQQFASGDLSFGASAVTVGQNVTLDVGNDVTDNIVGYAWSNQGTGNMTVASGNASAGDTDGSANDSVSIIDLTDQSHPTVNFDTAEENKTIRLTLYGRLNQEETADKNIDVELVDATTIGGMISAKGGDSVTISGSQAGFSGGVTFGIVTASADTSMNVSTPNTRDDTTNSKFSSDNWSGAFTLPDSDFTRHMEGRVIDRSDGTSGQNRNTSAFTIYPKLTTSRNVISPTSQTIFSQQDNPNTSTYPITFTFNNPTSQTSPEPITGRTYSEAADSSNAITLSDTTPSSQIATQATCTSTTTVGAATVRYTVVAAAGDGTTQSTATDCAVTVNYATNIYQTAASIGGQATINSDITFSWSWQGVAINSERYELINQDDDAQDGNDLDVTDVTGGGAQSRNSSGSQTKTVANFGVTNGGTYKIKITLFSDSGHTNAVANALTPAFEAFAITEFTSTIKGVGLEGAFFGYVSRLLAAENNSSSNGTHNRTRNQEVTDGKLFALNVNAGSLVATNNDLSTAFNPLAAGVSGATFFHRDGEVLNIGSDGVIDDVTDATPATPAINASTVSTATDDIEIRVAVNALVTRAFTVSVTPSGGSEATNSVNASNQGASLSQDISLKTIGFSLAAGTAHVIKIRGTNEAENGSYSSTRTFSTDAAAVDWTTTISNFSVVSNATSSTKTAVLINGSGDVDISSNSGNALLSYSTTSASTGFSTFATAHSNIGFSSGNFYIKVKSTHSGRFSDFATITVRSDNATSGDGQFTFVVTLLGTDESCIHNTIPVNISLNETRYIHQLTVGDMVLSYNMEKDIIEETEILDMRTPQHDNLYKVIFDDNQELLLTDDHPIFTLDNTLVSIKPDYTLNRYQLDAEQLVVGDEIKIINSSKEIVSFEKYEGEHDTYTIMTKNNNFYADGVLVHSEISSE